MIKTILKRAGFGFILGVAVCAVITAITSDGAQVSASFLEKIGSHRAALLLQLFLTGLQGAICMGGTVLYDLDRLPLALTTLFHCLMCVVPYFFLSLLLGWVERVWEALILSGIQIAAFFIIWLILYLQYRKQIKELNDIQNKNLDQTEEKP